MHGTTNVYFIWYGSWSGNTTVSILTDLANSIGGSSYFNINTTYYDGAGPVSNAVRFAGSVVVAQAKLGLAGVYEAGNDPTQALKVYNELTRPNAQSAWSSEAAMRREQLLSKHPELVKTNAPPASILSSATLPQLSGTNPVPIKPANPNPP